MDTVQTNVRVAADDKPLIIALAARLRADPSLREKLTALLNDHLTPELDERIKKLEQQVSWLLSGAIVVPRATPPGSTAIPRMPAKPAAASR